MDQTSLKDALANVKEGVRDVERAYNYGLSSALLTRFIKELLP